ncbi:CUB and sushi domain-containing protein 1-like isoform X2 [Paramacrobiotus metropolitanus]|uniref:CUB and sushi domain-containing protein 1-like isoform X2 n=1 Tax=Paramacrobiotus metropolitanus TaxID=2943436 RepID=UPI002445F51E|nr:CUB and sushi domain-containing protein 1-like isoform X2 [Paramacrobiotus metropolitanus]
MYRRIIRRICSWHNHFLMILTIFFSFHRRIGGQFIGWTQVHACRQTDGQLTLRCATGQRIMIFGANYGNASGYNCSTHFTPESNQLPSGTLLTPRDYLSSLSDAANSLLKRPRCNHDVSGLVKDMCSGREVCLIEMEESIFRSPCDGNEVLEVKFACIPGSQVISVCNRNLTAPDGHILSPGYPEYYPGPSDCSWRISTEVGKNILIMLNDLSLRPQSAKDNACQDYLIIYENDRQLVKTCHSYPFNLQVASNFAKISLISTSKGWTSKGVWIFYKAIGCSNPQLPDSVEQLSRNYTNIVLRCQDGYFFRDLLYPFDELVLNCLDGNRWDRSVPDCSNDSEWRKDALARLHARRADMPIPLLNGITLKEVVIPATVVGVLLLILIAALGILLSVRRYRRRGIVYHEQEIEHLHVPVSRKAPRAQIDSASDLAGTYPLTEIRD